MVRPNTEFRMQVMETPRLTLRVDFGSGRAIGPGKIRLLEAIDRTGSISQAGRALGMSYRRGPGLFCDTEPSLLPPVGGAPPGGAPRGGAARAQAAPAPGRAGLPRATDRTSE